MPTPKETAEILTKTEDYLRSILLPFWIEKSPDPEYGGFLTYFDRNGQPTGETDKSFLMQIRMLYTMASAHRAGFGDGHCADLARMGAEFIASNYWDEEHGGWFWIADRHGKPTNMGKIGYGQCFALYAFSEYSLATRDPMGREWAERTYQTICDHMTDDQHGGYFEIMRRDWKPERPGPYGGDRKSMDVHMHMMEALTTFFELTRDQEHRQRLLEVVYILLEKMLRPDGTGYMQFTLDFRPLPAILFRTTWGRDAVPEDGIQRPLDFTSYGHNVEFAWLLLHAVDVLELSRDDYRDTVCKICDHCVQYGIDHEHGGVFTEGPNDGPTVLYEKQFWQQAEAIVGLADVYGLCKNERYWDAFLKVYDFIFAKFVNLRGGGEWYERVDREGNPVDDSMAHAWKISYHTVRSMIQTVRCLRNMKE